MLKLKKNNILILVGVVLFSSCATIKKYENPAPKWLQGVVYRTNELPKDSLRLTNFSWKAVFADLYLKKYIQTALDSNLDIRIAMENIEIADAYLKRARVNNTPALTISPDVGYSTSSLNTQFGRIIGTRQHLVQYTADAQASWEIDVWGKLKSQQRAAIADYRGSVASHQAVTSRLVAEVANSYYNLLALDAQKKVLLAYVVSRTKYIESTKSLKRSGQLSEVAVKQAEAQLYNVESRLIALDYNIAVLENYIHLLMAQSPGTLQRNSLETVTRLANLQSGYPVQLLENRPDVRVATSNYNSAFEMSNAAKMEFNPAFTITANAGLQSLELKDLISPASLFANVVGGMTKPIFGRRMIKTNYEVSKSQQNIAYANLQKTLLLAVQEVSNALAAIKAQSEVARLKKKEYESYALATEFSQDLVNNGLGNYLDIIVANERALTAELEYIQARTSQLTSQIQLYKSLGGGWR